MRTHYNEILRWWWMSWLMLRSWGRQGGHWALKQPGDLGILPAAGSKGSLLLMSGQRVLTATLPLAEAAVLFTAHKSFEVWSRMGAIYELQKLVSKQRSRPEPLNSTTLDYQRTNPGEYQIVRTPTKETIWIQDPASPNHQEHAVKNTSSKKKKKYKSIINRWLPLHSAFSIRGKTSNQPTKQKLSINVTL